MNRKKINDNDNLLADLSDKFSLLRYSWTDIFSENRPKII